jgi:hypothetical protein
MPPATAAVILLVTGLIAIAASFSLDSKIEYYSEHRSVAGCGVSIVGLALTLGGGVALLAAMFFYLLTIPAGG